MFNSCKMRLRLPVLCPPLKPNNKPYLLVACGMQVAAAQEAAGLLWTPIHPIHRTSKRLFGARISCRNQPRQGLGDWCDDSWRIDRWQEATVRNCECSCKLQLRNVVPISPLFFLFNSFLSLSDPLSFGLDPGDEFVGHPALCRAVDARSRLQILLATLR